MTINDINIFTINKINDFVNQLKTSFKEVFNLYFIIFNESIFVEFNRNYKLTIDKIINDLKENELLYIVNDKYSIDQLDSLKVLGNYNCIFIGYELDKDKYKDYYNFNIKCNNLGYNIESKLELNETIKALLSIVNPTNPIIKMDLCDLNYLFNDKTFILDKFDDVINNNHDIKEIIYIGNSNMIPNFKELFINVEKAYTILNDTDNIPFSNNLKTQKYILYRKD